MHCVTMRIALVDGLTSPRKERKEGEHALEVKNVLLQCDSAKECLRMSAKSNNVNTSKAAIVTMDAFVKQSNFYPSCALMAISSI